MPKTNFLFALAFAYLLVLTPVNAQESDTATDETSQVEEVDESAEDELFSDAELQELVAPVALYPDTLLIQILVGATAPIDVVKADRLLLENEGSSQEELEDEIKAQGYDPSVEVLAIGFPTIVNRMAENIEWTETIGNAMLAQSDDVMDAVQVKRDQAIETGALIDTEEQTVSRDETSDSVIIQPADPEVVYVPQYDSEVVYAQDNTGDIIAAGLITFGTILLVSEIFDDDDDWYGYWGCRNCGGWGGGPIYRNPNINIDVDGNVNIGNEIDIDRPNDIGPDGGWKPSDDRKDKAQDRISERKDKPGATTLGMKNSGGTRESDALRKNLSEKTGAKDISTGAVAAGAVAGGAVAGGKAIKSSNKSKGLKEHSQGSTKVNRPKQSVKPSAKPQNRNGHKAAPKAKPKVSKQRSGSGAKAASHRGGSSMKKANIKRRR
ncbi:hypothetical protein ROA7450_00491 [Roseovarius albus]|uniref:DUF3300 domain-containing protein n=1 Tax=Roseovarius albus TaxID=1247867 RepID=A0A1X6YCW2_9RHOB|nr:DUF3300 domain-containing protein [Roseovarius albus]SLN16905.1 hypothetical protein ROA7450_00491 [Roseovarius albus]